MSIPGFTAEAALGGGGAYRSAMSRGSWVVSGKVMPQQALRFPTPCGHLAGCAHQQCVCNLSGGVFVSFPFIGFCGICFARTLFGVSPEQTYAVTLG
jgi:hypothetical protein